MKHLGLVHILLLLGVGLLFGQAAAELTAYQDLIPSANVGQTVMVTVSLTYNGYNSTQAVVTPYIPVGIVASAGSQSADLYPGITQQISYPLEAQQSGTYWIVSDISYAEDGTWRNLRLEAPFTAIGQSETQPTLPDIGPNASSIPAEPDPFAMPPGVVLPQKPRSLKEKRRKADLPKACRTMERTLRRTMKNSPLWSSNFLFYFIYA